jgi:hypothetical protein
VAEDFAFAQIDRAGVRLIAHPAAQRIGVRPIGDRHAPPGAVHIVECFLEQESGYAVEFDE